MFKIKIHQSLPIIKHKNSEEKGEISIEVFYEYRDPEIGRKPVTLATRREDTKILGPYRDRIGDAVIVFSPEFDGQHEPHSTTARRGVGDPRGLIIRKGTGVEENYLLQRTVWLTDIILAICYVAELSIPEETKRW